MGKQAAPAAPEVTSAGWADGKLTVTWNDVDDKTVAYNVVIKTPDGKIYSNLPVNADGKLLVSEGKHTAVRPGVGEYSISHAEIVSPSARQRISSVNTLPGYSVGVQAISMSNETSSPITWASDVTGIDDALVSDNITVKVIGDNILVSAPEDVEVRVIDMLGRTIATGAANNAIAVNANGVLFVLAGNSTYKVIK